LPARGAQAGGFDVHVIDNLCAGKKENVNEKATLHVVDIRNYDDRLASRVRLGAALTQASSSGYFVCQRAFRVGA